MKTSLKEKLISVKSNLKAEIVCASAAMMAGTLSPTVAFASDAKGILKQIADVIVTVFPYIGIFLVLIGAYKLINVLRNDQDPNGINAAVKDIAIGAVLVGFTVIWNPISDVLFGAI